MNEVATVHILNTHENLVSKEDDRFETETTTAKVKEVL